MNFEFNMVPSSKFWAWLLRKNESAASLEMEGNMKYRERNVKGKTANKSRIETIIQHTHTCIV